MIKKIFKYLFLSLLVLIPAVILVLITPSLWRNRVLYPKIEREAAEFQKLRKEPVRISYLNTCRGVMHIKLRGKYVPWLYSNPIYVY